MPKEVISKEREDLLRDKLEAIIEALQHHEDVLMRCLRVAISAMQAECKPFNFPDEDRPNIHLALCQIRGILEGEE